MMRSDEGLLEQVLQEARSRALEIRNEIAVLKYRGSSNTVTVPQLLKGDAIPDVAEPEGKPDVPECSLQYNLSTPSGEQQAPPKTEDGTDTEEQQIVSAQLYYTDGSVAGAVHQLTAGDHGLCAVAPPAHVGRCSMDAANPVATGAAANSWQGIYKDVVYKLTQSMSFKQHFLSGSDTDNLLQEADLASNPDISCITNHQMATPFAGDTCQAVAIAAGAITIDSSLPSSLAAAGAQRNPLMLISSPLCVVESPCQASCLAESATGMPRLHAEDQPTKISSSSGGGGNSMHCTAASQAASGALASANVFARQMPGVCHMPLVLPASAADLPVQAVLQELNELLAWQASRLQVGALHQQAGANAAAHIGGSTRQPATGHCAEHAKELSRGLNDEIEDKHTSMVTRWLQAVEHQHITPCRSNSASWGASEDACYSTRCNSTCSASGTMRRSKSMPTAYNQSCCSDEDCTDNCSTSAHSNMKGSASLRDNIATQLNLAAAFRPWYHVDCQPTTASTSTAAAQAETNQTQADADCADAERWLSSTAAPAAVQRNDLCSVANAQGRGTLIQHQQTTAVADTCTSPGSCKNRTGNLSNPRAGSVVSLPAAAVDCPQLPRSPQSPSRPALLYQKLLQSPLGGGGSDGRLKFIKGRKQLKGSTAAAGGGAGGLVWRAVRCHAVVGQQLAPAGPSGCHAMSPKAHQQQHSTARQIRSPAKISVSSPWVAAGATAATSPVAGDRSAEEATAPEVAQNRFALMPSEAGLDKSGSPDVVVASLSLGTLLNGNSSTPKRGNRKNGLAQTVDCCSSSASSRYNLPDGTGGYGRRAASKKAIAGPIAAGSLQDSSRKRAATAVAAEGPGHILLGAYKAADLRRTGYAMSAGKQVSRMQKAAAATVAAGSGCEEAMASSISCGQLLQEAAIHEALIRVSGCTDDPEAAQQSVRAQGHHLELAQQQLLGGLDAHLEDGGGSVAQLDNKISAGLQQRPEVMGIAKGDSVGGALGVVAYRLQPTKTADNSTPTAAAAASAALQALAAGASRRGSPADKLKRVASTSGTEHKHSGSNSVRVASELQALPGVSRSSSARSRMSGTSSASGASRRVWRPGGQGTSPKDNCKKLQAYESARRALIGAAGSSASTGIAAASYSSSSSNSHNSSLIAVANGTKGLQKPATPALQRSGLAHVAEATTAKTKVRPPVRAAAQVQATAGVAEQGVQANIATAAAAVVSASTLVDELRHRSQPHNRHTSPGRLQRSKPSGASASEPAALQILTDASPAGHCSPTIDQVEQAIQAAQVALLQRRWQISQMRKAMQQHGGNKAGSVSNNSLPRGVPVVCRATAGSRAAATRTWQSARDQTVDQHARVCGSVDAPEVLQMTDALAAGSGSPLGNRPNEHRSSYTSPSGVAACRSISSGGIAAAIALPAWSAPRRVSSNGMTGQELMEYYRKSSAAETAEAAAAAAEAGAALSSTVPGAMNLDAMLRAYDAMYRRKSNEDKAAALAVLLGNIVTVAGVQADCGSSHIHAATDHAATDGWSGILEGSCQQTGGLTVQGHDGRGTASVALADEATGHAFHHSSAQSPDLGAGSPVGALAAANAEGSGLVIVHKGQKPNAVNSVKLCDTATGRAVLSGVGNSSLTMQQAVHWLQVGLTRMPAAAAGRDSPAGLQQQVVLQGRAGAGAGGCRPMSPIRRSSPSKGRPHSRPCSPFRCFSAREELSDEEEDSATVTGQLQDDVHFVMDESNQLMISVPQQLHAAGVQAGGVRRYKVTGVSLLCDENHPDSRVAGVGHCIELVTCVGRHRIELASHKDWAGVLAGLNAMLLLHEANGASKLSKDELEELPVSQIYWSSAIEGVQL